MISELSRSSLKEAIACALHQCRAKTLTLFESMDETTFCCQAHPNFSPVGWHLGHIAYTESFWILERCAGLECLFPQYRKLFAADGLPKTERVKLPNLEEILDYLDTVRKKVLGFLEVADQQELLWHFLLQHESQHSEIITFVLELQRLSNINHQLSVQQVVTGDRRQGTGKEILLRFGCGLNPPTDRTSRQSPVASPQPAVENPASMIHIPAGKFEMGNNSIHALDNERPMHEVYLEAYWIDRYPVTCGQYRAFLEARGYQNPHWWSQAGWEWLQTQQVKQPLYWSCDPTWDNHPVCGVSWYEAEAYSRFVNKGLPTEAQWEKAASWDATANRRRTYPWGDEEPTLEHGNYDNVRGKTTPVDAYPAQASAYGLYDALGNVWEWTASWFDGYPGFQSYPYVGYSQVYFDNQHRVLKGGSWATRPWVLRSSFRNWYHPGVRQIFAGFRCVRS
ncbi:MAG: ergothioneine biosynthesis protein EgtB [Stigonema ocellatum SAG 48.90 = DSM 106950]|nr:ergothioneine biosynthesis protein EgtB [Stigonema ocellatum SAG 48.90 = DSM 106950]